MTLPRLLLLLAVLTGCEAKVTSLSIKQGGISIKDDKEQVELLVESEPGMRINCNVEMATGDFGTTDAAGKLTLEVPWKNLSIGKHEARCDAYRNELLKTTSGELVVQLERSPRMWLSKTRGIVECGGKECDCIFSWKKALNMSIKVEKGTTIELGGTKVVSADDVERTKLEVSSELLAKLPDAPLEPILSGKSALTAEIKMHLTWPNGATAQVNVAADATASLDTLTALLEGLEDGPVKFPAEKKATPSLLMLGDGAVLYGTAERVRDVEKVAIFFYFERKDSCGTYTNKADGHKIEVTNDYRDIDLSVYERRTGRTPRPSATGRTPRRRSGTSSSPRRTTSRKDYRPLGASGGSESRSAWKNAE